MPDPIVKELVIAGPLQNVSIAYKNANFIGDRVFPIIDGVDPKAKVAKYLKGAWFRNEAALRGAGGRAPRGGYKVTWVSLAAEEYALAKEVTDEDRRFAKSAMAPPLEPDQDAIEYCANGIDLSKEIRICQTIKDATWADGNATGEDAEGLWSPAGSTNTFLADIKTGKLAIQAITGLVPNCLQLDFATYEALKECDAILEKIKYTQRGVLTRDLLAAVAEVDEVLVGDAIENTAKETKTATEFTSKRIWEVNSGKGMAFLFYRPKSVGRKVPTAGYQYRLRYDESEGGGTRRTTTWREAAEHQDVYEVAESTDISIAGTDLGYKWRDTYAT